ncbi:MAG: SDR family NAD(P)-dependent oxidoreductase [Chloroflexi bacterium]|nr:SDR family NAD(P)-dependent oxidoreductase [Chloroflexota bacterium]
MGWSTADIPDLGGRTAVITGANGGLGSETARELARKGAHVVMAVRDLKKASAARDSIARQTPGASLELIALDLGSLASVRSAATSILAAHPVIDILVNNAGVMGIPHGTTSDGIETQFGVNHLGHFALTALLLPAVARSDGGRIVCITSPARLFSSAIDPDDPTMAARYDAWRSYGRSKLAMLQFAVELDRRLGAAGATAHALAADPGFSHTDLQANSARQHRGMSQRFFAATVGLVGSSPATGALPQLRAATDPTTRGGELYALRFVVGGSPIRNPYLSRSMGSADLERSWSAWERMTGLRFDVAQIVRTAGRASAGPTEGGSTTELGEALVS